MEGDHLEDSAERQRDFPMKEKLKTRKIHAAQAGDPERKTGRGNVLKIGAENFLGEDENHSGSKTGLKQDTQN